MDIKGLEQYFVLQKDLGVFLEHGYYMVFRVWHLLVAFWLYLYGFVDRPMINSLFRSVLLYHNPLYFSTTILFHSSDKNILTR